MAIRRKAKKMAAHTTSAPRPHSQLRVPIDTSSRTSGHRSHVSEHALERVRDSIEIESLDEQVRVPDLPPAAASQPTTQLILDRSPLPRSLLLERPERTQIAFRFGDLLHPLDTDGADQLVLQVFDADIEPA